MTTETSPRSSVHHADRGPSLDPLIELYQLDSENMILKADEDYLRVRGPAISDLILALNGATPTTTLSRNHGAGRIDEVLRILGRRGLLARNDQLSGRPPSTADPDVLGGSVVAICPAARWFVSALGSVIPPLRADVQIVITDSYLRPDLAAASAEGGPWLLVKVGKGSVWVSPVFAEGRAPCWNCVRTRILARDERLALLLYGGYRQVTLALGPSPTTGMFARENVVAVAAQIERQLTRQRDKSTPGCLVRITRAAGVSVHPVVPFATCVACGRSTTARGGGATAPSRTPRPASRGADLWLTLRTRLDPLLDPITGVVSDRHVYPATSDNAVVVAVATYANPSPGKLSPATVSPSSGSLIRHPAIARFAFGGGVRADDARARAVLEAVERYCTSGQGDESDCHASLADLGDSAFHPNDLMCFDVSQLARKRPVTLTPGELYAPLRYTEDISLRWCTAVSLTGVERWLPVAYCYRMPEDDPDSAYCVYDSNGSAVAFSMDDAIVSGFLEVVERDAVAIWWYNKIARPVVDLESFGDDFVADVAARQRVAGSQLSVFDVTGDLDIPTFVAMSVRRPGDIPRFGFGAHFNAHSALRSALVELGQAIRFHAQESRKWVGFDWSEQSHLAAADGPPRRAKHYPDARETPTVRECAAAAAAVRAEVFIRDCTRADIGLPCVKVVVPGLRGIQPRFGPGRLFDVPARMGWLAEPRARTELNTEHLRP
ncbi:MAG: TOMM precursor leader peptide-binding protein [Pseudonocardiales bacterium]